MLVLLPARVDGLDDLERSLTPEHLHRWTSKLSSQRVTVALPKFTITWGASELSPVLRTSA